MAIRISTQGTTQLQLAAGVNKPDFTAARSIAGTSGQIMGYWMAYMVRLSGDGAWTSNARRFLLGGSSNPGYAGIITENAAGTSEGANAVFLGPDSAGTAALTGGALRLRPRVIWRTGGNVNGLAFAYASGSVNEPDFTGLTQMTRGAGTAWLCLIGVTNTAAQGSAPVWRGWAANCLIGPGGVASSDVTTIAPSSNWLSNTGGSTQTALMRQIFHASGTGNDTPVGTVIEHVALCQGDFPWDTTNNRPHHHAIQALAGVTGVSPLTYASLVAAQNASTLPYANCRQGRGDLTHHWPLANLGSLTSTGSATPAAFAAVNYSGSGGLTDEAAIAPLHWQGGAPTITEPFLKAHGGGGTLPFTIGGTYQAGTTALERRWVLAGTSTPVAGFNWGAVDVFGGGAWQTADTLPFGHFDLQVRDTNDISRSTAMNDFLVGTFVVNHGQSGSAIWAGAGLNAVGVPVAAGAQGLFLLANPNRAGTSAYVRPVMEMIRLRSGETPATLAGHGTICLLNEWHVHNPGHPLIFANMAISDTVMAEWTANSPVGQWTYLGTVSPPGVAGPEGSGVVGFYAWAMRRYADVHIMHWNPNMGGSQADRDAYVAAIDARFSNAPGSWWATTPPWRVHRALNDGAGAVSLRERHVLFHAERGPRGVLGPCWPDTVMDGNPMPTVAEPNRSSGHPAFQSLANSGGPISSSPTSDQNLVGAGRLGLGYGRLLAYVYDRSIKAHGPRLLAAWTDDGCTSVQIELGRAVRTLNGAAISRAQFWVTLNNAGLWERAGAAAHDFTVTLDATGTRAVLAPVNPAAVAAWAGALALGALRVDYGRAYAFNFLDGDDDERLVEPKLHGLLYDSQSHRGGVNLAAPAGNPLPASTGTGVAVAVRGPARLLATERWTGNRTVTVQMIAADGVTMLKERELAISAS